MSTQDRETPDFAALAQLFPTWTADDLEIIWSRNEEITKVSDLKYFLKYCREYAFNPIVGEVIATMRYDSIRRRMVLIAIVKIGVLRKRRALECDGLDEAKFTYEGSSLVSASGAIYRKGCSKPFSTTVYFSEYAPKNDAGSVVQHWREKPHIMLGACLEAQLTRIAFFDLCGDFLTDEETQASARTPSTTDDATPEDDLRVAALAGKIGMKPVAQPRSEAVQERQPLGKVTAEPEPPAPPEPPIEAPAKPQASVRDRMAAVKEAFGAPGQEAKRILNEYCRGFFNSETLPNKEKVYLPLLDKIETEVSDAARLKALVDSPRKAGAIAAGRGPGPVEGYGREHSWDLESMRLLREIALARGMSEEDAVSWMEHIGIGALGTNDVRAFLNVAMLTRNAYILLELSKARGKSVSELAESMKGIPSDKLGQALEDLQAELPKPEAEPIEDDLQEGFPF
jgi:hypothetical protein